MSFNSTKHYACMQLIVWRYVQCSQNDLAFNGVYLGSEKVWFRFVYKAMFSFFYIKVR